MRSSSSSVGELWAQPVHECRMACVELLSAYGDRLDRTDAPLLEGFLRESRTWALVDGLAISVVGRLVERCPELKIRAGDRWATDGDFWLRRSALLALLVPLREGRGDFEQFGRYADSMSRRMRVLRPQGNRLGAARHRS